MTEKNKNLFVDYKQTLFRLASDLRRLKDFSEKLNLENSMKSIELVLQRVETGSFSIAVVGEFKRGKSTFINALLGREILPSDILPTTATLNRVTYGLKPLVRIMFKDGGSEEVAIDRLANYITKLTPESEAIAATVKEAVVYYPIPYCQNHVDIIDTPGLSDDEHMTAVTLSVLPHVDAAVLVIMAQSPLSKSERDFLEENLLTSDLGQIIFVVTGIDRCNSVQDAEKVLKTVEERIDKYVMQAAEKRFGQDSDRYKAYLSRIGKPKVFGISAYQALEAKLNKDRELLRTSRFEELEAALEKFLAEKRGAVFLQVPVNRAIASAKEILATISSQSTALSSQKQEAKTSYEAEVARGTEQSQAESLKQFMGLTLNQLETQLKQAASQAIDSTRLMEYDLSQSLIAQRLPKLDHKVASELESHCRKLAGKIQMELRRQLAADVVSKLSNETGKQFVNLAGSLKKAIVEGKIALKAAPTSNVRDRLKQMWASSDRVTSFKSDYKTAIFAEIATQLSLHPVPQQVYESVAATLETSGRPETQNTLAELRVQLELIDRDLQELDGMRIQTQSILSDAQILSEQLMQVIGVTVT